MTERGLALRFVVCVGECGWFMSVSGCRLTFFNRLSVVKVSKTFATKTAIMACEDVSFDFMSEARTNLC